MADCIPYRNISYYSDLILDYLEEKESLQFAYHKFPSLENFKFQLQEKGKQYSPETRKVLVSSLNQQYTNVKISKKTRENIDRLSLDKTFTITTGHQLNLFTGPLYFFYKIISVINLTKELKKTYPNYNFVPIYWMASEDHDFGEINYFNFENKKIHWNSDQGGAVGHFSTKGLEDVLDTFSQALNASDQAEILKQVFKEAYVDHDNLTEATRYLANEFLGKHGLVIVDGDDIEMKRAFTPYTKRELLEKPAFKKVNKTAEKLSNLGYGIQVNPREINLFYLSKDSRDRIIEKDGYYFLHKSEKRFTKEEILEELENHPERFSPNAIMRPLYQEMILPNLCYVGGSGELAYWLELKDYFVGEDIVFPSLLLRNSALLVTEKQQEKRQKLNLSIEDLFLKQFQLMDERTKAISEIEIDFTPQKEYLVKQFKELYDLAEKTDKSFLGAVAAQEHKQKNGLNHLEKRLLKAQKRKLKDELERSTKLQDRLFPNENLQEREANFSEFYQIYGDDLIEILFDKLKPLNMCFNVVTV